MQYLAIQSLWICELMQSTSHSYIMQVLVCTNKTENTKITKFSTLLQIIVIDFLIMCDFTSSFALQETEQSS